MNQTIQPPEPDFSDLPIAFADVATKAVAAVLKAGRVALVGPPGTGKTIVARRLVGALPPLTAIEAAEMHGVYRAFGMPGTPTLRRPFRAPHHTISSVALSSNRGGELELARHGMIFFDDLVEFPVASIEGVRYRLPEMMEGQPLVAASITLCPCGWRGQRVLDGRARECTCEQRAIDRWTSRVEKHLAALGISERLEVGLMSMGDMRAEQRCPATAEIVRSLVLGT